MLTAPRQVPHSHAPYRASERATRSWGASEIRGKARASTAIPSSAISEITGLRSDRNPVISLMAEDGIAVLARALPRISEAPQDRVARSDALYGAWLCGTCLGAVSMALHHKLCHVLGGTFDLPHAETHTDPATCDGLQCRCRTGTMTRVARATRSGPRSPTCRAVRSQGLRFRGADGDGRRSRGLTSRHFSEEGAIRSRTATHPSANPVRVPDSRAADIVHIGLVWRQSIHVRYKLRWETCYHARKRAPRCGRALYVGLAHGPWRTPSAQAGAHLRADLGGERPQHPLPVPDGHRHRRAARWKMGGHGTVVDRLDRPPRGRAVPACL